MLPNEMKQYCRNNYLIVNHLISVRTFLGTKAMISGSATDEDWKNVDSLKEKINRGINIIQEDIERIQRDQAHAKQESHVC